MAKLTNRELYKYAERVIDKSNSVYIPEIQFQEVYEDARMQWFKLKAKDFEVTEAVREDLRPFVRKKNFGEVAMVRFNNFGSDNLFRITAVHGDYSLSCNGKVTTYTLPVVPRTVDQMNAIVTDPFNQPDDTEPMYVEDGDNTSAFIEVYSTTTPKSLTVHYLKYPEPFLLLSAPNAFTEEEQAQQYEILDIAIKALGLTIENPMLFQGMGQEIQSRAI